MKSEYFKVASVEGDFEYCSASFGSASNSILCLCLYRSPSGDINVFLSNLTNLLDIVCRRLCYIIVCGDFNVVFNRDTAEGRNTIDLFKSYDMHDCFCDGTRLGNCIDNVFCSSGLDMMGTKLEDPGMSDHMALLCDVRAREPEIEPVFRRIFSIKNINSFNMELSTENWDEVVCGDGNINSRYELFYNI